MLLTLLYLKICFQIQICPKKTIPQTIQFLSFVLKENFEFAAKSQNVLVILYNKKSHSLEN